MRGMAVAVCLLAGAGVARAQEPLAPIAEELQLLQNGDFTRWEAGVPVGWTVDVGARSGEGPEALCVPLGDAGLSLSGDRTTVIWKSVSQRFAAAPTNAYRLSFTARVGGRRREAQQFDNCWVGFFFADAEGRRLAVEVYDVRSSEWQAGRIVAVPPAGTASATAIVFLSQTGTLQVRDLTLTPLPARSAGACYDLLVAAMDRHYSYFAHKQLDWRVLAAMHRARALEAESPMAFVEATTALLAELRDLHVTIAPPEGPAQGTYVSRPRPNINIEHVVDRVHTRQREGKHLLVGRTKEGLGYILVADLPSDPGTVERMAALVESMADRPGIILDLRGNGGGSERTAQRLLRMFVDQRRVYALHAVRAGPSPDAFTPAQQRVIKPDPTVERYAGPVVVLIGPHTVSSGEGMALMCKALPHVRLLGQATRGASGNPKPFDLPNGVTVWFSRWVSMLPDGTPFEDTGIPPDEWVDHPEHTDGDPTFDRAIGWLQERLGR